MSQSLLFAPAVPVPPRVGTYRTILADPPWLERGGGQIKRGADRHYPLMPTADICRLPVSGWAAPDAHLYLWVTNNFLAAGLEVMKAWGFRYVTKIDWYKGYFDVEAGDVLLAALKAMRHQARMSDTDVEALANQTFVEMQETTCTPDLDDDLQIGLGQYFRGCTESCLFGVRGKLPYRLRENGKRAQGRTGLHAPRGEHSAKPEKFRAVIEAVSHGPYLELFARRDVPNWDVWGNEC